MIPVGPRRRLTAALISTLSVLVALTLCAAPGRGAEAVFRSTAAPASNSFATATLAAPTGFAASRPCPGSGPSIKGSTSGTSNGTSLVLTTPSAAIGDVLIAYATASAGTTLSVTDYAWQPMGSQTINSQFIFSAWALPLTSAPAASYTFSWGSGKGSVVLLSYTGVDPYTPLLVSAQAGNSTGSTSLSAPTMNATRQPGTVVMGVAVGGAVAVSDPAGMTRRFAPTAPDSVVGLTYWDAGITATGTTTAYSTSWSGTQKSAVIVGYLQSPTTPVKDPTVTLSWTAAASPVAGYSIARNDGATFTVGSRTTVSLVETSTTASTAYTYTITSTAGTFTSSGSAVVNVSACP